MNSECHHDTEHCADDGAEEAIQLDMIPRMVILLSFILVASGCSLVGKTKTAVTHLLMACPGKGQQYKLDPQYEGHFIPVDLSSYKEQLYSYQGDFRVTNLATLSYKDQSYAIHQIRRVGVGATRKLLIFVATHGYEFAPIWTVPELLDDILRRPVLYGRWDIQIITPINPVGVHYASRWNEDGCDINRDFKAFKTLGARIQRDAINSFRPDVIVSLHEAPNSGFFVFAESSTPDYLVELISERLEESEFRLAERSYFGNKLEYPGVWHKGSAPYLFQTLIGMHTLGRYTNKLEIPTLTTESSWNEEDLSRRVMPHLTVIRAVIEGYR